MSEYTFYFNALKGVSQPIRESEPQPGFWAARNKGAPRTPVAIWRGDKGTLIALVGFKSDAKYAEPLDWWTRVCSTPVEESTYRQAFETGEWPGGLPAEAFDETPKAVPAADGIVTSGHNQPPEEPETDKFKRLIEATKAAVSKLKVNTDEIAGKAQSARSRLLELARDAEKRRVELKEPHLRAGKAVDETWMPIIKGATEAADALKKAIGAFETAKLLAAQEAERKRQADEEEARRAAEASGSPPPASAPATPEPEPVKTQVKGDHGRAAAKKIKKVVTIKDQDAVYKAFRSNEEVAALLLKLAQKAVDNNLPMPADSITITEQVEIR